MGTGIAVDSYSVAGVDGVLIAHYSCLLPAGCDRRIMSTVNNEQCDP